MKGSYKLLIAFVGLLLLINISFGQEYINEDLEVYYPFDNNNLLDVSGNGKHLRWYVDNYNDPKFHAQLNGSLPTYTTSGKIGGGFEFDGNNDYISGPLLDIPEDGNLTIAGWFYVGDIQGGGGPGRGSALVTKKTVNSEWEVFLEDTGNYGRLACRGGEKTNELAYLFTSEQEGAWHHFACSINGAYGELFWDGNLVDSGTIDSIDNSLSEVDNNLVLGKFDEYDTYTYDANGTLDEVAIWSRPLASDEINQIYTDEWSFNCSDGAVCAEGSTCNQITGYCEEPFLLQSHYHDNIWYDDFEDYGYHLIYSLEDTSDITGGTATSADTVTSSIVEGDGAVKIYESTAGSNYKDFNISFVDCKGDTVAIWVKTDNVSDTYNTGGHFGMNIGQDSSNHYHLPATSSYWNNETVTESGKWYRIDVPKTAFPTLGSPSWDNISFLRLWVVSGGGSSQAAYYDHLYCYESWNWLTSETDWDSFVLVDWEDEEQETIWLTSGGSDQESCQTVTDYTTAPQGVNYWECYHNISKRSDHAYGYTFTTDYYENKPFDLSKYNTVSYWFYINDTSFLNNGTRINDTLKLLFYTDYSEGDIISYDTALNEISEGWNYIEHTLEDWDLATVGTTIDDLASIESLRFTVRNNNNTNYPLATVRFDDLKVWKKEPGRETLDDWKYQRWYQSSSEDWKWEIQEDDGKRKLAARIEGSGRDNLLPAHNGHIGDFFDVIWNIKYVEDYGSDYAGMSAAGVGTRTTLAVRGSNSQIVIYGQNGTRTYNWFSTNTNYSEHWGTNIGTDRIFKFSNNGEELWWSITHDKGRTWREMFREEWGPKGSDTTFYHADDPIFFVDDARVLFDFILLAKKPPTYELEETNYNTHQLGYISENINPIENITLDWYKAYAVDDFEKYTHIHGYSFESTNDVTSGTATYSAVSSSVEGENALRLELASGTDDWVILDNFEPFDCNGDSVVFWVKHSDVSQPRPTFNDLGNFQIGQDSTNRFKLGTGYINNLTVREDDTWYRFVVPKSEWEISNNATWTNITWIRLIVTGVSGSGVSATFDHLYCTDENYDYKPYYIDSFEYGISNWVANDDTTSITEGSGVEGEVSLEFTADVDSDVSQSSRLTNDNNFVIDINSFDNFVLWFYINDSTQLNDTFGVRFLIYQNETENEFCRWYTGNTHLNLTFEDGWNRVVFPFDNIDACNGISQFNGIVDQLRFDVYNINDKDHTVALDNFYVYNSKDNRPRWIAEPGGAWDIQEDRYFNKDILEENKANLVIKQVRDVASNKYLWLDAYDKLNTNSNYIFTAKVRKGTGACGLRTSFSGGQHSSLYLGESGIVMMNSSFDNVSDNFNFGVGGNWVWLQIRINSTDVDGYFKKEGEEWTPHSADFKRDEYSITMPALHARSGTCYFDEVTLTEIQPNETVTHYFLDDWRVIKANIEPGQEYVGDVEVCYNNSVCRYDITNAVEVFDYSYGNKGFGNCNSYLTAASENDCLPVSIATMTNSDGTNYIKGNYYNFIDLADYVNAEDVTFQIHGRDGGVYNPHVYLSNDTPTINGGIARYEVWNYSGNFIGDETVTINGDLFYGLEGQWLVFEADGWSALVFDNMTVNGTKAEDLRAIAPSIAPQTFSDSAQDYYYYLIEDFNNIDFGNVFLGGDSISGSENETNNSVEGTHALNFTLDPTNDIATDGDIRVEYSIQKNLLNYNRFAFWLYIEDKTVLNCSYMNIGPIRLRFAADSGSSGATSAGWRWNCTNLRNGWNLLRTNDIQAANFGDESFTWSNVTTIRLDFETNGSAAVSTEVRWDHLYGYRDDKWFNNYVGYEDFKITDDDSIRDWSIINSGDATNLTAVGTSGNTTWYKYGAGRRALNLSWTVTDDNTRNSSSWYWDYRDYGSIDISKYDNLSVWVYVDDITACGSHDVGFGSYNGFSLDIYSDWTNNEYSALIWNCSELSNGWNYLTGTIDDLLSTGGSGGPLDPTNVEAVRIYHYNDNSIDSWILIDDIRAFHTEQYYNFSYTDYYSDGSRGEWDIVLSGDEYDGLNTETLWLKHTKDFGTTPSTLNFGEDLFNTSYQKDYEIIFRTKIEKDLGVSTYKCGASIRGTTRDYMTFEQSNIRIEGDDTVSYFIPMNNPVGTVRWGRIVYQSGVATFYYKNASHEDWVYLHNISAARPYERENSPALVADEGVCLFDSIVVRELSHSNIEPTIESFDSSNRGYNLFDSFDNAADWNLARDGTSKTLSNDRVERETSIEFVQDISLDVGNDFVRLSNTLGSTQTLQYYDKFVVWLYTNDSSSSMSSGGEVLQLVFYSDATNFSTDYKLIKYFNGTDIVLEDGWNRVIVDIASMTTFGNFNISHIEAMRIWLYNDDTKDILNRLDHMYAYNSSLWWDQETDRYGSSTWEELYNSDNEGKIELQYYNETSLSSTARTHLAIYDPNVGSDYTAAALKTWDYENFQVYLKVKMGQDLGGQVQLVSFIQNESDIPIRAHALWLNGTEIRTMDDFYAGNGQASTNVGFDTRTTYLWLNFVYNNSLMEMYWSNDSQQTWNLVRNYSTVGLAPVSRIKLACFDAHCLFDNVVVSELPPYNYTTNDNNFSPSYVHSDIYDGNFDRDRSNVTYKWFVNGSTNASYTDVVSDPTDFSQSYFRELAIGNWYANITTCYYNTDINCSEVQSEEIIISEVPEAPVVLPVVEVINITPAYPYEYSNLTGFCKDNDDDGTYDYYWQWYNGSTLFSSGSYTVGDFSAGITANVTANNTRFNETWTFRCRDNNGANYSLWVNTSVDIHMFPYMNMSYILPANPSTNDNLLGYCKVIDLDNDTVTYYYNWYINGTINETGNITGQTSNVAVNVANISSNYTTKGDIVTIECLGSTFEGNTSPLNGSVAINNSQPVAYARVEPLSPLSNDTLIGYCNGTDSENENLTYYYIWYRNNNSYLSGYYNISTEPGIEVNVNNLTDNNTGPGEVWRIDCIANDNISNSTQEQSNNVTIFNVAPVTQTSRIEPVVPYVNENLVGYCNVTDFEGSNITYDYIWYKDGVLYSTGISGEYVEGIEQAINTLLANNTGVGENWTFGCRGDDGGNKSNWLNSTGVIILETLSVNTVYVTPTYPDNDEDLHCNFNVNDSQGLITDVIVSWYNGTTAVTGYDYTFSNVTLNSLYTTTIGTGSLPQAETTNYDSWRCEITVNTSYSQIKQNSSFVNLYPLENLTLIGPPTNIVSIQPLNATFTVIDYDGGINCSLNVDNTSVINDSVINGTVTTIYYTPGTDGNYTWNVSCQSDTNPPPEDIVSENRYFIYDTTPVSFDNFSDNSNAIFPEINDTINLGVRVFDNLGVHTCKLQINDNGSFWNYSSTLVNSSGYTSLVLPFTVREVSTGNNTPVNWSVWCNDTIGQTSISVIQTFYVKDLTLPVSTPLDGNFFSLNNNTVISNALYPLQNLSWMFWDYGLFQAEINITCDINGTIYYWQELDFNVSQYNHTDIVNLTGLDLQRCNVFIAASDDHTDEEIGKYNSDKLNSGIEFETDKGTSVRIKNVNKGQIKEKGKEKGKEKEIGKSKTSNNRVKNIIDKKDKNLKNRVKGVEKNIKDVKTKKEKDRYTIEFELEQPSTQHTFLVESDYEVFPRPNSEYPGHFVIWNKETKSGTWVDFAEDNVKNYEIIKINDYAYEVDIETYTPVDKFEFESIGGTNIVNSSYDFYIGGIINISTLNKYDNGTYIDDWTVDIVQLTGYPQFNQSFTVNATTEIAENLTNGTYTFTFTHSNYFTRIKSVVIENSSQNLVYDTFESVIYMITRNIKTGEGIPGANYTVTNTATGDVRKIFADNTTNMGVFYLNASTYNFTVAAPDYKTYNNTFSLTLKQNLTLYISLPFVALFNFYDERTLELFNISSADKVNFLLFCPTTTYTTLITNTTQSIPIDCNYTKFKLVLDYGVTSYYRTFILEPENVFNQSIYLIDLTTTQYVYNSLIVDDLLSDYENPSVFVKRLINDELVIITSDFIDIENKIGAYLIENREYIIEVHSDNNPIRVIGFYSADIGGDKILRLYGIDLASQPSGWTNSVSYATTMANISGNMTVLAVYDDLENQTNSVTFNVYSGSYPGGAVVHTSIVNNASEIEFTWDATAAGYENDTLYSELVIDHQSEGLRTFVRLVNEITRIPLAILNHISPQFMNWFITLFLGVLAIMATISTANHVSMVLIGFAALFVLFGWYQLAWGIIALAGVIALLSLLKQGDKNMST